MMMCSNDNDAANFPLKARCVQQYATQTRVAYLWESQWQCSNVPGAKSLVTMLQY